MSGQQSGLRFDIYERVHLPEGAAGIQELDGVEIVPQIQVETRDDQAVLKGNLLLNATYRGEGNTGQLDLSHSIPVEITMPVNRTEKMEDIAVQIENFDIDLLSSRSLNVTGVLSLHGLEMIREMPGSPWTEEEEIVFVHRADDRQDGRQDEVETAEPASRSKTAETEITNEAEATSEVELVEVETEREEFTQNQFIVDVGQYVNDEELGTEEYSVLLDEPGADPQVEWGSASDDKKEMKIAFGSKPSEEEFTEQDPIKAIFNKMTNQEMMSREPEASKVAEIASHAETDGQADQSDELEWKKLFIGASSSEGDQFRRMRICIVQKDETLDTIAERYQMNVREIVLYNRLADQEVSEGQAIYIPK